MQRREARTLTQHRHPSLGGAIKLPAVLSQADNIALGLTKIEPGNRTNLTNYPEDLFVAGRPSFSDPENAGGVWRPASTHACRIAGRSVRNLR